MKKVFEGTNGFFERKAPGALAGALRLPGAAALGRRWRTWLPSLVLLPLCLYFLVNRPGEVFLDSLNLLVHEAGHLCFFFLGDVLHAAGGTLMQVLLPATLAGHFWQYRSRLGMQVSLVWLGQNCLGISVYAADARLQELDLLANRQHDWTYLLGQLGLLEYDVAAAYVFCFFALLAFLVALLLPLYVKR